MTNDDRGLRARVEAVVARMKDRKIDHRHEDEIGAASPYGIDGRAYFYAGDIYDDYCDLRDALEADRSAADTAAEEPRTEAHIKAEALREAAEHIREVASEAWGGETTWITTGTNVASLAASWLDEMAADRLSRADEEAGS